MSEADSVLSNIWVRIGNKREREYRQGQCENQNPQPEPSEPGLSVNVGAQEALFTIQMVVLSTASPSQSLSGIDDRFWWPKTSGSRYWITAQGVYTDYAKSEHSLLLQKNRCSLNQWDEKEAIRNKKRIESGDKEHPRKLDQLLFRL